MKNPAITGDDLKIITSNSWVVHGPAMRKPNEQVCTWQRRELTVLILFGPLRSEHHTGTGLVTRKSLWNNTYRQDMRHTVLSQWEKESTCNKENNRLWTSKPLWNKTLWVCWMQYCIIFYYNVISILDVILYHVVLCDIHFGCDFVSDCVIMWCIFWMWFCIALCYNMISILVVILCHIVL